MWNPAFRDAVYEASLGTVHLHDGPICSVHVHTDPLDPLRGCTKVFLTETGGNAEAYPGDVLSMGPFAATDKLVVDQVGDTVAFLVCG